MQEATITPRMPNVAALAPEALHAIQAVAKAAEVGLPAATRALVSLRASQINGCSVCTEMHARELKQTGASDERVYAVAAWRESPYFSPAERAALALTEAGTRIGDRPDPVPDDVWAEATTYYDERALASLVIHIGLINLFNRVNVITRQPSGPWVAQAAQAVRAGAPA
jgi:AhpD family alkylhydroperoxidase